MSAFGEESPSAGWKVMVPRRTGGPAWATGGGLVESGCGAVALGEPICCRLFRLAVPH
jgi:hypothetical protein